MGFRNKPKNEDFYVLVGNLLEKVAICIPKPS